MKYALLIYDDQNAWATMPEDERNQLYKEYFEFSSDLVARGVMRGGEELQPTSSATTVTVDDGKVLATDGPFAETKEQLGGFYIVECDDLDQAIEHAARIPSVRIGGRIEIRPVVDHGEAQQ